MIIARIQSSLERLRPSERRVADVVLAFPNLVVGSSIKMIAAQAQASEPTVIRFCRAVGCVGVQELKRQIAQDLGRMTPPAERLERDPNLVLASILLDRTFSALFDLKRALSSLSLDAAIRMLTKSERVLVWGLGETVRPLDDFAQGLVRLGINVRVANDPHVQWQDARQSNPSDVLLIARLDQSTQASVLGPILQARSTALAQGAQLLFIGNDHDDLGEGAVMRLSLSSSGAVMAEDFPQQRIILIVLLEIILVALKAEAAAFPTTGFPDTGLPDTGRAAANVSVNRHSLNSQRDNPHDQG